MNYFYYICFPCSGLLTFFVIFFVVGVAVAVGIMVVVVVVVGVEVVVGFEVVG